MQRKFPEICHYYYKSGVVGMDQGTEWKFPFIFLLSSLMASPSTETGDGRWSRLWSVTARQREDTPASEMSTRYSHVRSDV